MERFSHIDVWLFDLDNTLYAADTEVFPRIHQKMSEFVANELDLPMEEAHKMRTHYYHTYGTTLRGLMEEHKTCPQAYVDYVHDIDLSDIEPCQVIQGALEKLPGRKIIFTNASAKHAENMTKHLGIDHHFEGIFDIIAADCLPKPNQYPYDLIVEKYEINPQKACMVEDMAKNLRPAAAMGMTTLWLYGGSIDHENDGDHIHHRAISLADWFKGDLKWKAA